MIAGPVDTPIGLGLPTSFRERTTRIEAGSRVLLYTDGLVERSGESLQAGFDRLVRAGAEAPEDLEAFSDHLLDALVGTSGRDDVALLALRVERIAAH